MTRPFHRQVATEQDGFIALPRPGHAESTDALRSAGMPSVLIQMVADAIGAPPLTARGRSTYTRIVEGAHLEFMARDYHDVSVQEIARRSGVSIGSIYRYFTNKEGLFLVVLANCLGELYTAASRVWAMPWSYLARLEAAVQGYLEAFLRNRKLLGSANRLGITSTRVRDLSRAMSARTHSSMLRRLEIDQESSQMDPLDSEVLMRALRSMMNGYAQRAYIENEFGDEELSSQRIASTAKVLAGIWYRSIFGVDESARD